MHDIRLIRDNPDAFDAGLRRRGLDALSAELIALDERRRAAIQALQEAQERRNALSREVGAAKKAKDETRAAALMAEVATLKDSAPALEAEEKAASDELQRRLAEIPNIPNPEGPDGADETGNMVRHEWGKRPAISGPKQHFELAEAWKTVLGPAMDFESAAKLSGSRFVVLKGQLARLERALGQFMLDLHTGLEVNSRLNEPHGYTEGSPPLLVRDEAMFGTAQLPKFAEDQFFASELEALAANEPELKEAILNYRRAQATRENLESSIEHGAAPPDLKRQLIAARYQERRAQDRLVASRS